MQIVLDTTGWKQIEVNLIPGTIGEMLHGDGLVYTSVHCENGTGICEIVGLDGDFPYTAEQIQARIQSDDAARTAHALD